VPLEGALELVLLYHRAADRRFEQAARWHAHLCAETRPSPWPPARPRSKIATLGRGEESHANGVLADILDAVGAHWLVDALEEQATEAGG